MHKKFVYVNKLRYPRIFIIADKGIPTDAIFNYFLKGLSFSLQKSIAHDENPEIYLFLKNHLK